MSGVLLLREEKDDWEKKVRGGKKEDGKGREGRKREDRGERESYHISTYFPHFEP